MTEKVIKIVKEIRQNLTIVYSSKTHDTIRPLYDMLEEIEQHIFEENMKLQVANQQIDTLKTKLSCEELLSQMWKTEVENLAERYNTMTTLIKKRQTDDQNR